MLVLRQTKIHSQRQHAVQDGLVPREHRRGRRPVIYGAVLFSWLGLEYMVGSNNAQNGQ